VDERAAPLKDDSFLILFNAHVDSVIFTMPPAPITPDNGRWTLDLTTARPRARVQLARGDKLEAPPRSVTVLRRASRGATMRVKRLPLKLRISRGKSQSRTRLESA
jgi:hypothetical protein